MCIYWIEQNKSVVCFMETICEIEIFLIDPAPMSSITDFVNSLSSLLVLSWQSAGFLGVPEYWKEVLSSGSSSMVLHYIFKSRLFLQAFVLSSV